MFSIGRKRSLFAVLACALGLFVPSAALPQGALLQGGPWTPGHAPMYIGSGQQGAQAVVQDSGPAGGGAAGLGLSESLQVNRTATGTGPNGMHNCKYSAAVATGNYYYLCTDAAAQGGAQIAYGAVGNLPGLPLQFLINGQLFAFPDTSAGFPSTRSVTANATVATTDCGNIIQAGTGSTGFFTLTLPSVSGFTPGCVVEIKNGDTTRGKALSGFPADLVGNVLWPLQTVKVAAVNGAWATLSNPGVWVSPAGTQLNVDHTNGSDSASNDCLGPIGTSGACRTILHAFTMFQTNVKVGVGGQAIIQSDCNFTESPGAAFLGPSATGGAGGGAVFIIGNTSSPSSCIWTSAGVTVDDGAVISLNGFQTANAAPGQNWLQVTKGGIVVFGNMIWGQATGGDHAALSDGGVLVYEGGTYQVGVASCAPTCFNYHIINGGGTYQLAAATISVPSVLTFSSWYVATGSGAISSWGVNTYTGAGSGAASTGIPYNLSQNATLALNGSNILPGNAAGVISSGACIDDNCRSGAILQGAVAAPTGTASLTGVMMGLGSTCAITPRYSTRLSVTFTGSIRSDTANDGAQALVRYGTGATPANGAAPSGTSVGNVINYNLSPAPGPYVPFSQTVAITGLTIGTAYWLDVQLLAVTGGTASISLVGCSAHEI